MSHVTGSLPLLRWCPLGRRRRRKRKNPKGREPSRLDRPHLNHVSLIGSEGQSPHFDHIPTTARRGRPRRASASASTVGGRLAQQATGTDPPVPWKPKPSTSTRRPYLHRPPYKTADVSLPPPVPSSPVPLPPSVDRQRRKDRTTKARQRHTSGSSWPSAGAAARSAVVSVVATTSWRRRPTVVHAGAVPIVVGVWPS